MKNVSYYKSCGNHPFCFLYLVKFTTDSLSCQQLFSFFGLLHRIVNTSTFHSKLQAIRRFLGRLLSIRTLKKQRWLILRLEVELGSLGSSLQEEVAKDLQSIDEAFDITPQIDVDFA
jgi:hypothetical protein